VVISRLLQIAESFDVYVIESHRTYRRAARRQLSSVTLGGTDVGVLQGADKADLGLER
jgi:hypothetical protein